jgi:hypothetical protein
MMLFLVLQNIQCSCCGKMSVPFEAKSRDKYATAMVAMEAAYQLGMFSAWTERVIYHRLRAHEPQVRGQFST